MPAVICRTREICLYTVWEICYRSIENCQYISEAYVVYLYSQMVFVICSICNSVDILLHCHRALLPAACLTPRRLTKLRVHKKVSLHCTSVSLPVCYLPTASSPYPY
jgi:hypothetical protein